MFSFTIAAAIVALQAAPAPAPLGDSARRHVARAAAAVPATPTPADHLDSARRALANGAFDIARREYVVAAALERDAGRIPVEASFGLAHVLYAQSYNREAAIVLGQLAAEASKAGDVETEAKARMGAVWLHLDAGQRSLARADADRLRVLARDNRLSEETRRELKQRLG